MKKLLVFLYFFFLAEYLNAQRIINGWYFLEQPVSGIFDHSYVFQNFKMKVLNDPRSAPSATNITNDDFEVYRGATSYSTDFTKGTNNSFLFNTWNHGKNLSLKTSFKNIKHVMLKNDAYSKIKDNLMYAVEALRADTVEYTLTDSTGNAVSTDAISSIVGLFVGGQTVVGKILSFFDQKDSSSSTGSIVKLKNSSKHSVTFELIDTTVYYAVKYAIVGNAHEIYDRRKIAAPSCATKLIADPPDTVLIPLARTKGSTTLLQDVICDLDDRKIQMKFTYDQSKDIDSLFILQTLKNPVVPIKGIQEQPTQSTLYSVGINFGDDYSDHYFKDTYRFAANVTSAKKGVTNELIVCDFDFWYDKANNKLYIVNYPDPDNYYHTCIYYMAASITYYP